MRGFAIFLTLLLVPCSALQAQRRRLVEPVEPEKEGFKLIQVWDFRFLGGQYYFGGAPGNLTANTALTASPTLQFSERLSLVNVYTGGYRGVKEVRDLVGGGTLFQDMMDHSLSTKLVFRATPTLKLKTGGGFRMQLLRETKDETWFKGLFDFRKPSASVETEWEPRYTRLNVRGGYDFFFIGFPNYVSLESQAGQDSTVGSLGRELAGSRTLDSNNHHFYAAVKTGLFKRSQMEFNYRLALGRYLEQKIVTLSGDLSPALRRDTAHSLGVSYSGPILAGKRFGIIGGLGYDFATLNSNQNHYDARKTFFNADYYDYTQHSLSPSLSLLFGAKTPTIAALNVGLLRRFYKDRLIQDVDGTFQNSLTQNFEAVATFTLSVPFGRSFRLVSQGSLGHAESNHKYEKVYRSNYTTANYLLGFNYAY